MLGGVRGRTQRLERAIAAPFLWLRVPPTAITVATLAPALAAAYYASTAQWLWAFGFGFLASVLDVVDGTVARSSGQVTRFGGFVDSTIDRVVDLLFLFGVGLGLDDRVAWFLVGACAVGAIGTSYARARIYEYVLPPKEAWHRGFERGERIVVLGIGALGQALWGRPGLPLLEGALVVYALGSNLTFAARVATARRLLGGPSPRDPAAK